MLRLGIIANRIRTVLSSALGSELVDNGGFDSGDSWTTSGGWTISGGTATNDGTNDFQLTQNIGSSSGVTYRVSFDISGRTAGVCYASVGAPLASDPNRVVGNSNGSFERDIVGQGTNPPLLYFYPVAGFNGSIDNVSVKEVL